MRLTLIKHIDKNVLSESLNTYILAQTHTVVEPTSTTSVTEVRESPDVAQSDCVPDARENEVELARPWPAANQLLLLLRLVKTAATATCHADIVLQYGKVICQCSNYNKH